MLPIWPIESAQLPSWINNRLKLAELTTNREGLQLLADHVSGNLLAAMQEIEKLSLVYGKSNLTTEQISNAIADNSRFNIFDLLDAAMTKNIPAINKILDNLKNENCEPTLILWAITKELRTLINISLELENGSDIETAITQNKIWPKRKPLIKKALTKHTLSSLQRLLKFTLNIDLIIKGADNQHLIWHELRKLYLAFASR